MDSSPIDRAARFTANPKCKCGRFMQVYRTGRDVHGRGKYANVCRPCALEALRSKEQKQREGKAAA